MMSGVGRQQALVVAQSRREPGHAATPPGRITERPQGASRTTPRLRLVMRCSTVTSVPSCAMRISISFSRPLSGSTGWRMASRRSPSISPSISTGPLSSALLAGLSGAAHSRCPPRFCQTGRPSGRARGRNCGTDSARRCGHSASRAGRFARAPPEPLRRCSATRNPSIRRNRGVRGSSGAP